MVWGRTHDPENATSASYRILYSSYIRSGAEDLVAFEKSKITKIGRNLRFTRRNGFSLARVETLTRFSPLLNTVFYLYEPGAQQGIN